MSWGECVCVCVCGWVEWGLLHCFCSQCRLQYLPELVKALIKFQLISPRTCRQPCVTPTSHRLSPSRMTHPHSHSSLFYYLISLLLYCEHKSELWGRSPSPPYLPPPYPLRHTHTNNNEPCHYLCFNWLCRRNTLDRSQNNSFTQSSSHAHVILLLYFGSSMARPHSSLLEWHPVFSLSFLKRKDGLQSFRLLSLSNVNNWHLLQGL